MLTAGKAVEELELSYAAVLSYDNYISIKLLKTTLKYQTVFSLCLQATASDAGPSSRKNITCPAALQSSLGFPTPTSSFPLCTFWHLGPSIQVSVKSLPGQVLAEGAALHPAGTLRLRSQVYLLRDQGP